ncbi:Fpg/Nei family DNA glycosylase [Aporhodopirellula aestuarii]|uniref:DNA-(apurinic or apyrimidinic site) lyase n=1 Tax=Aporhodopirellula aestuarii TaxID=2950107 RepID=A0ABT0U8E5_9BACT|nr:DNA glycosylase [Aporhodopirellula aestuarii]MCM2373156.1 Fpg/Nei family DNA glycosylase [Aporhodopirellula aestuarii]
MPEGHKTHFLAAEHSRQFAGEMLKVTSPQGRFTPDAKKVNGRILESVTAAGKHLFYGFEGDRIVHVHLGRYGSFVCEPSPPSPPRGQVRMRMVAPEYTLDLRGPTQCRVIDSETRSSIVDKLGPDPLAGGRKADFWSNVSTSGKPIGGLLLDQSVIAGIGNILRAEILFETGIDPNCAGKDLTSEEFASLWKSLTKMMKVSLKHGRIISVTAGEAGKPLAKLNNRERFRVYGKTECPRCGGPITNEPIASRKLYACPNCQGMNGADRAETE